MANIAGNFYRRVFGEVFLGRLAGDFVGKSLRETFGREFYGRLSQQTCRRVLWQICGRV